MAKDAAREAEAGAAASARAASEQAKLTQAIRATASAQASLSVAAQASAQAQAASVQMYDAALMKLEGRLASAKAKIAEMGAAKVDTSGMEAYQRMLQGSIAKRKEALASGKATPDVVPKGDGGKGAAGGVNAVSDAADRLIGKRAAIKDVLGSELGNIASAASAAGGPLGALSDKVQSLAAIAGKGGAAGAVLVLVAALIAVATAAIVAAVALARYALAAADAARSSRLFNNAAAGSAKGGGELSMVITDIAGRVPLAKERIEEMGRALELAGLKGRRMQVALEMIAMIESAVPGAGAKIQALAEQFQKVKRAVLTKADLAGTGLAIEDVAAQLAEALHTTQANAKAMLQNGTASVDAVMQAMQKAIEKKFGKTVAAQMMALGVQFDKMKENIAGLFADIDLEAFLGALKSITDLFSQQNAVGKALRPLLSGIFTGLFNAVAKVMPFVKGFLIGMAIAAVVVYIAFKKVANAVVAMFGGGAVDKAKMLQAGLIAGKVAAYALVIVFGALTATALTFAAAMFIVSLPIIALIALIALVVAAIYSIVEAFSVAASGGDPVADSILGGLLGGLVEGIMGMIPTVVSAMMALGGAAGQALLASLGIHSPSTLAKDAAENVTGTFADTTEDGTKDTQAAFSKMVDPKAIKGAAKAEKAGGKVIYIEHHGNDESLAATIRVCMRDNFAVEMLGAEG